MLVFIHLNKTGGRTVRYVLRSSYGTRHCEVEPDGFWQAPPFATSDLQWIRKFYRNVASIAGHRITGYVDLQEAGTEFRYFTLLRDPLNVCASRWQHHVDRKKSKRNFGQWIEGERATNPQTRQIAGTASAEDAIRIIERKGVFVGLMERFDESLVLLKALRAGDLNIAYTPVNVARRKTVAEELIADRRKRQAIIEANEADFELYEYAKSCLYPALQREYGCSLDVAVADYRRNSSGGFNQGKLAASRLKQYALYRPLMRLRTRTRP
jgi:hypothetical protein